MRNGSYQIYSVNFIVYLIVSVLLVALALFLIKKYVKSEKAIYWIIKGSGIALAILIIVNKIVTVPDFDYNWWMVIPESFCALSGLLLGIFVAAGKPNNIGLHALTYFSFLGGLLASVYPTYLSFLPFWSARAFTGLLHHTLMLFLTILMIITGYIKPTIKRWYVPIIGYMLMVVFGLFEIQVLKHPQDTMSINVPLISALPHLTSWWGLGIGVSLACLIFLVLYEHFYRKKAFKKIFIEMIHR